MALVTDSSLVDFLLAFLSIGVALYFYLTRNDDYWDKRGVKNVKRGLFIRTLLGVQSQSDNVKELYNQFPEEKYAGLFQGNKPALMIRDPDTINQVLVKDFSYFQDRGNPEIKNDPLISNLFNLRGYIWRSMRYKLTPTFTTGKLRAMFEQVSNCGKNMMKRIEEVSEEKREIESKDFLTNYTIDVISSCAFGLEFQPGSKDFTDFKNAVTGLFQGSLLTFIRVGLAFFFPKLGDLISLRAFPVDIADYFVNLIKATMKYRKENNYVRNDYMQLLLTLKEQEESGKNMLTMNDTSEDDAVILDQLTFDKPTSQIVSDTKLFTEDSVCANSIIFLTAGSESTSSTISFTLFELSRNPSIQTKLQHEVDKVLAAHGNKWSYDALKEMTYLEQVVQESQRLYPIVPMLQRECLKTYKVPGSELVIEQGALVVVPVVGLHHDPVHYPDPERFDPDRFEGNNFKPNPTFLPFGDGPRICIAMRFAVMEVKSCIAHIMSEYSVKLSPKTKVPLEYKPRSFLPTLKNGIWVTFEKREKSF